MLSITDSHPKVKLGTSKNNEVHNPPVTVPYAAYQRERARRIQAERERDQYRSIIYNTKLNPQERIYTVGIIDAVRHGRHKDEQGRTRINQEGIAERLGVTSNTIGSARKMLAGSLIKDSVNVKVKGETYERVFIELDEEIASNPSKIERAEPRKIKENRHYRCQKCDSEDITIRTTKTIICNCCKHESLLDETYQEQKEVSEEETTPAPMYQNFCNIGGDQDEETTPLCTQNFSTYKNQIPPPVPPMYQNFCNIGSDQDDIPQPDQIPQIDPLITMTEAARLLVAITGPMNEHIDMSDGSEGKSKYYTVHHKLTLEEALKHLQGAKTRGGYCSYPSGETRALCWDVDTPEEWEVLQIHARALAAADYLPILEPSPAGRGGHLWIVFDGLVDAITARFTIHALVPELAGIKEYWPAQEYGKGNRVRLPGGRYTAYGKNEWCHLLSVSDGETSTNGDESAQLLLTHQTPASILPTPDPDDEESELHTDQVEQPQVEQTPISGSDQVEQAPTGITNVDARWEQQYGQTPEGKRLWFAWTDEYLIARYNARTSPEDLIDTNRQGKALATWRGERTASVAIRGEQWTDFGASARHPDGSPDSGDAFELYIRLSGKTKSQVLGELGKALVREARQVLESAARSAESIPEWLEEIITPAGRAHYNLLQSQEQSFILQESTLTENRPIVAADPPEAEHEEHSQGGVSGFQNAGDNPPMGNHGYTTGSPCPQCACELYRPMAGEPACIRCYPKNGSADLADKLYPKRQPKVAFGM
jgi:hypothetical protein